ncbi:MAG: Gfo/Idh/MocA family oxidoreductase [Planctomycetota bacterium]|nr:Gfo/Idh/MocA family oxidoreductase [Planctomycetota bacterium]
MKPSVGLKRRDFLKVAAAAIAFPYFVPASARGQARRPAPSDRIVMAGIGIGNQGGGDNSVFQGMPDVQMVAICDVKKNIRDRAKANIDRRYNNSDCKAYTDFRELLQRPDIDAIHMAVPDHWHALLAVFAMLNGKDVYCQKPLSLTVHEGRQMVLTANRLGRVFSCGSQRVWDDYKNVHRMVRSGSVGQVREGYVDNGGPSKPCDLGPEGLIPEGMDWDMWLGPAPMAPYNPKRCDGGYGLGGNTWRSYREYSGGGMTDWGGHKIAAALFAMGLEHAGPVSVNPPDGKDYRYLTYTFANGAKLYHAPNAPANLRDVSIVGTNGIARNQPGGRGGRGSPAPEVPAWDFDAYKGTRSIYDDFILCVKTRQKPFQNAEVAHRAASCCHLGNICYWLNRPLKWDPAKEDFINDAEASRWLSRPMRAPWILPTNT